MKEKPILFNGAMVRAILESRKTQTRRILPENPVDVVRFMRKVKSLDGYDEPTGEFGICSTHARVINKHVTCPYGKQGTRLWVRETWCPANSDHGPVVLYPADSGRRYLVDESYPVDYDRYPAGRGAWSAWAPEVESGSCKSYRPSIHMPRWASRITLKVTDVRVERLQDISEEDAQAEGIERLKSGRGYYDPTMSKAVVHGGHWFTSAREAFATLWSSINGPGSWEANPWVYALTFVRVDTVEATNKPHLTENTQQSADDQLTKPIADATL